MKKYLPFLLLPFLLLLGFGGTSLYRFNEWREAPVVGRVWTCTNATTGEAGWSNAPASTPAGNSGAIQFNESGALAGTNRLTYDRTNDNLSGTGALYLGSDLFLWGSDLFFTNSRAATVLAGLSGDGAGNLSIGGGQNLALTPTNIFLFVQTNGVAGGMSAVKLDGWADGGPSFFPLRYVSPFTEWLDLGYSTSAWRTVWTRTNQFKQGTLTTGAGDAAAAGKVLTALNSSGVLAWSNVVAADLIVSKAGGSSTNVLLGGTVFVNATPVATAGTAVTNLMSWSIPAHALTNNGDRLRVTASGSYSSANAKAVTLAYGSQTVIASASAAFAAGEGWTISADIVRTGNTAQNCNAVFSTTIDLLSQTTRASHLAAAQTNGIATVLKITGDASVADGEITNTLFLVEYHPAPR